MKILELLKNNKMNNYLKDKHLLEEIRERKIGILHLPTGVITVNDPLVLYEVTSYDKIIAPGNYSLYVYEHFVCEHKVNAFLELRINDNHPISFEKAMDIEIESGTIGFMDASIEKKLVDLSDDDAEKLWCHLNEMYENKHIIDYSIEDINIIGIDSGYGNGYYSTYYGIDEYGEVSCIIADFQTVNVNDIDYTLQPKYFWGPSFDEGEWHYRKIFKDELPLDKLAGYNHLAIYLRWAIEHQLISQSLLRYFTRLPGLVLQRKVDLRMIIDQSPLFNGELSKEHFNDLGREFTESFYLFNKHTIDYYPSCVDHWAETFLGSERYHCEEYKDEAYLFVPYDEVYYQGLSKYIDKKWQEFINKKYQ